MPITLRRVLPVLVPLVLLAGLAPTPARAGATSAQAGPAAATAPRADRGTWRVIDEGAGHYEVSWTSPSALALTSDRPTITGAGLTFGPSTTRDDGRTVHAGLVAPSAPDPADLDVVLSGDRLDEPGTDPVTGPSSPTTTPHATLLDAPDPALPGPYPVTTSDYDLPAVKLPGMPQPIEMIGHVVEPASDAVTGPRPLVLFLHGRHGVCYDPSGQTDDDGAWPCRAPLQEIPSHLGYDYIQQTLASQGYATVSIRANGINAQDYALDDGGAGARAALVERHLDYWAGVAAAHQVDLSRVILVGHSRGGEGVDRAAIEIPTTAPYRIVGQVLLAPTDFASHTAPQVSTITLLPYCDGDVSDIEGQRFTDTGRDVSDGDTSLKSSVLVMGADHNFFNTEWTPGISAAPSFDDWGGPRDAACGRRTPERLTASEQREVGTAYVAGAVKLFLGDDAYLPMFDGSPVTVPSIGDAVVRSHALGGGRTLRRPGIEATPTLPGPGASSKLCVGETTYRQSLFSDCGRLHVRDTTPHWRFDGERQPTHDFLELYWGRAGAAAGLRFDRPLDLSSERLALRSIVDPRLGDVRIRVRISDANGGSAVLTPVGGELLPALLKAPGLTKLWAQAVLVDASGAIGVDLTRITSVDIVGQSQRGRLWIADVAAAPSALPPAPTTRLPQINVGDLTVAEGDGGPKTARVPFTITGNLTTPSRFVALSVGQERGSVRRMLIDVAPGQTHGTIPVGYHADRTDDQFTQTQITVWPSRGLTTDDYLGVLKVRDDDPTPVVSVRTLDKTITEGEDAEFRVSISQRLDHPVYVFSRVVRGTGRPVRGTDVPTAWYERHADPTRRDKRLYAAYVFLGPNLAPGATSATVKVPTSRDDLHEKNETITVVFELFGQRYKRTVQVLDQP